MALKRKIELYRTMLRLREDMMQANDEVDRAESWLEMLKDVQKQTAMRYESVMKEFEREPELEV